MKQEIKEEVVKEEQIVFSTNKQQTLFPVEKHEKQQDNEILLHKPNVFRDKCFQFWKMNVCLLFLNWN